MSKAGRKGTRASLADYQAAARWLRLRHDFERGQAEALAAGTFGNGASPPDWFLAVAHGQPDMAALNRVAAEVMPDIERLYVTTARRLTEWQRHALVLEMLNRRILELLEPEWTDA